MILGWCVGRKFFVFCCVPLHTHGHNKKFMARYIISPRIGTIHITKWEDVMAMRPHLKMGANVMLMLYEGTEGFFLFIDDIV